MQAKIKDDRYAHHCEKSLYIENSKKKTHFYEFKCACCTLLAYFFNDN